MNDRLCLPRAETLFQARADRFRQLAQARPALSGYLSLMADLSEIQHSLVAGCADLPLPPPRPGQPPLSIGQRPRQSSWRTLTRTLAERLRPAGAAINDRLNLIREASDSELDAWADALLALDSGAIDAGLAPFLFAALQVQWASEAARLEPSSLTLPETGPHCPACGSLPVASALRTGGAAQGLCYLCCGLCQTQWRRTRIQCALCGSGEAVSYYGIEGGDAAVKAEACGYCMAYIKRMDREKEPKLDPLADDIATLPLDMLMAEAGYARLGFNPLLLPPGQTP